MDEIRIDPDLLALGSPRYLQAALTLSAAAAPFRNAVCLRGPVGTSLALSALDRRVTTHVDAAADACRTIGFELVIAASLYLALEGA